MNRMNRWRIAVAAALSLLVLAAGSADATPAYAKTEQKPCSFCHVGKTTDKVFTEAGKRYAAHHTLEAHGETGKAPAEPPAPTSMAPAGPESAAAGKERPCACGRRCCKKMGCGDCGHMHGAGTMPPGPKTAAAGDGPPCGGDCACCKEKGCDDCGHMHGSAEMPPMMEKMKGHLEEMKKAVASLRESEKTLEGSAGSDPFRTAVLDHLRKLDDLQASHIDHMETMMGRMHKGREAMGSGMGCRHGCKEKHGCREKHGCDCPCGGKKR